MCDFGWLELFVITEQFDLCRQVYYRKVSKQAGAEQWQAQVKLEVVVEIIVEFGVEVEACHY